MMSSMDKFLPLFFILLPFCPLLLNHSLHLESSSGLAPYKLERENREMDPGVFLKFIFGDRGGS